MFLKRFSFASVLCIGSIGFLMVGCSGPDTQVNQVAPEAAAKMEADQKAYEEEMDKPRVGP